MELEEDCILIQIEDLSLEGYKKVKSAILKAVPRAKVFEFREDVT